MGQFYDKFSSATRNEDVLYLSPYLDFYGTGTDLTISYVSGSLLSLISFEFLYTGLIITTLTHSTLRATFLSLIFIPNISLSGMQVSVCAQVRRPGNSLHGVLCIDQTIAEYFDGAPYYNNQDDAYAFVFNSDLNTLIHPLLSQPTTINNDFNFVRITSLEPELDTATLNEITRFALQRNRR